MRIASEIEKVRHWEKSLDGAIESCPRLDATWFVDPPHVELRVGTNGSSLPQDYDRLKEERHLARPSFVSRIATWLLRPLATIKIRAERSPVVLICRMCPSVVRFKDGGSVACKDCGVTAMSLDLMELP